LVLAFVKKLKKSLLFHDLWLLSFSTQNKTFLKKNTKGC
jgi:hypothetical protein